MEDSKLPLRLWAWAIYLELTVWKTAVKCSKDSQLEWQCGIVIHEPSSL